MTTSKMRGCHGSTTEIEKVRAVMDLCQMVMDAHEKQLTSARQNVTSILRELLVPVLNRWGMGMRKGGALLYLNPNIEGEDVVEVDKGCDYVLGELHDELAGALWEEVDADGSTLHDYIVDIDIPQSDGADGGVHYVWLTYLDNCLAIVDMTSSQGHELSDVLYYGPVTREYVEDLNTIGDDLDVLTVLDCLPKYKLIDSRWVRHYHRPRGTGEPARTPGLLKGEVGDAISEPLSDEELEQWGMTATE